jgi:preprotein translocase subunit SecY
LPHGGHSSPVQAVQSSNWVSGPIVTASIVLQLLKGADILHIDTSETRGQVMYMGLQKILILVMIVVEAAPNLVGGFMVPDPVIASSSLAVTCLRYPSLSSSRSVSVAS